MIICPFLNIYPQTDSGSPSMKLFLVLFFHGIPWNSMESQLENTPWNSMEIHVLILHGIPWKIFQRIPWNSMEFHGNPCPNTPWNSMENIPSNSMELHGIPWRYFTRVSGDVVFNSESEKKSVYLESGSKPTGEFLAYKTRLIAPFLLPETFDH